MNVPNPWQDAMLDEAVNTWCLTQENKDDPQKLLRDIIATNVEWDRDPRISDRPKPPFLLRRAKHPAILRFPWESLATLAIIIVILVLEWKL